MVMSGGNSPRSLCNSPRISSETLDRSRPERFADTTAARSTRQIKMRAVRLLQNDGSGGKSAAPLPNELLLLNETNLEAILSHVDAINPRLLIIDSIQTTYSGEVESAAGSVAQVRECAMRLTNVAKASGLAAFLIGHVTKEGAIAGPRVLEHIVDTRSEEHTSELQSPTNLVCRLLLE